MTAYLALAFSVGLLAILDTWIFVGPLDGTMFAGLVWISFIAWGCHFHSGGGAGGATTALVGMIFGGVVGMAAVMAAGGPLAATGVMAAPIAVGVGAFVICLASAISLLKTIPASVYGFAAIAGVILLRGDTPMDALIAMAGAVAIGAAFGFVSEMLANAMTKAEAAPAAEVVD